MSSRREISDLLIPWRNSLRTSAALIDAVAGRPLPDGPITLGIDGGYVRAAHKQGWFEVIAGKSVVAFRREEGAEVPPLSASVSFRPTTPSHAAVCGS